MIGATAVCTRDAQAETTAPLAMTKADLNIVRRVCADSSLLITMIIAR